MGECHDLQYRNVGESGVWGLQRDTVRQHHTGNHWRHRLPLRRWLNGGDRTYQQLLRLPLRAVVQPALWPTYSHRRNLHRTPTARREARLAVGNDIQQYPARIRGFPSDVRWSYAGKHLPRLRYDVSLEPRNPRSKISCD